MTTTQTPFARSLSCDSPACKVLKVHFRGHSPIAVTPRVRGHLRPGSTPQPHGNLGLGDKENSRVLSSTLPQGGKGEREGTQQLRESVGETLRGPTVSRQGLRTGTPRSLVWLMACETRVVWAEAT